MTDHISNGNVTSLIAQNAERGLSLIIPAYNEEKSIGDVLLKAKAVLTSIGLPYEIIVVNDGSTDKTEEGIAKVDGVIGIIHRGNQGYGRSLKTGIRASKYEYIVIADADGTYPLESIKSLLERMEMNDMVVGARTGKSVHIPLIRKPAKWVLNRFADFLVGTHIPDLNSGLRIMRRDIVMKFFPILPDGFSFTTTITLAMMTENYSVEFIPIDYHRRMGSSKIAPIRDTLRFTQLIVKTIMYFDPLKIFLPLSALFFLIGFISLIRDIINMNLGDTTVLMSLFGLLVLMFGAIADIIDKRLR